MVNTLIIIYGITAVIPFTWNNSKQMLIIINMLGSGWWISKIHVLAELAWIGLKSLIEVETHAIVGWHVQFLYFLVCGLPGLKQIFDILVETRPFWVLLLYNWWGLRLFAIFEGLGWNSELAVCCELFDSGCDGVSRIYEVFDIRSLFGKISHQLVIFLASCL